MGRKAADLVEEITSARQWVRDEVVKEYSARFPKTINPRGVAAIIQLLKLTHRPTEKVQQVAIDIYKFMLEVAPNLIDENTRQQVITAVRCDFCDSFTLDLHWVWDYDITLRICTKCLHENTITCTRCKTPFYCRKVFVEYRAVCPQCRHVQIYNAGIR